jgi:hypothetical protein
MATLSRQFQRGEGLWFGRVLESKCLRGHDARQCAPDFEIVFERAHIDRHIGSIDCAKSRILFATSVNPIA